MPGIATEVDAADLLVELSQQGLEAPVEDSTNPDATVLGKVISGGPDSFPGVVAEISQTDPDTGEKLSGTGYRYLWNTRTGERIRVHRNQLIGRDSLLRRRHKDPAYPDWIGKLLFSTRPTVTFRRGMSPCPLFPGVEKCLACGESHPPHPEGWWKRLTGVTPCYSAHLANPFQADRHLQKRHDTAYYAIRDARQRDQRAEDIELRQRELATQERMADALTRAAIQPREAAPVRRRKT